MTDVVRARVDALWPALGIPLRAPALGIGERSGR
jgi:hypothetical protein